MAAAPYSTPPSKPTNRKDHSSLNQRIRTLCSEGRLADALRLLEETYASASTHLEDGASTLLEACTQKADLETGLRFHQVLSRSGALAGRHVMPTRLITMYSTCGSMRDARRVFEELPQRNLFHWNALIVGYVRNALWEEAIDLFVHMLSGKDPLPDNFTLPSAAKACGELADASLGGAVHRVVFRLGISSSVIVCNSLVSMYGRCGRVREALLVFDKMAERNLVSWNATMGALFKNEATVECLDVLKRMMFAAEFQGPDCAILETLLPLCADEGLVELGRMLQGMAVKSGLICKLRVVNGLIDMYGKSGCLHDAEVLFHGGGTEQNVVSWSSMIHGYARAGDSEKAFTIFGG